MFWKLAKGQMSTICHTVPLSLGHIDMAGVWTSLAVHGSVSGHAGTRLAAGLGPVLPPGRRLPSRHQQNRLQQAALRQTVAPVRRRRVPDGGADGKECASVWWRGRGGCWRLGRLAALCFTLYSVSDWQMTDSSSPAAQLQQSNCGGTCSVARVAAQLFSFSPASCSCSPSWAGTSTWTASRRPSSSWTISCSQTKTKIRNTKFAFPS